MSQPESLPVRRDQGSQAFADLIRLTHLIYGLHALAVLIGVVSGAATILGSFVGGVPSIVAVIINYVKRSDVRGTWLDSHFGWQIRTFWYAVVWIVVFYLLLFTIVGIPLAMVVGLAAAIWVIYRVARGWLALRSGQPMPG